jgi:hypothetical protein
MASAEYRHHKDLTTLGLEGHHLNVARVHLGKLHAVQEEIRAEELLAKIEADARGTQRLASIKMQRLQLKRPPTSNLISPAGHPGQPPERQS